MASDRNILDRKVDVSIVMGVYNGAQYLCESVESILSQEGVNFEFIIVDDGSADESGEILRKYAKKDSRIRLIQQENQGLTRALIRGCSEAAGEFIARQDCGDISFPGRLAKQLSYFKLHPNVVLLSCWSEAVGPDGEILFAIKRNEPPRESSRLLNADNLGVLRNLPNHPTAMFPRMLYERAGGYRWQFYYAQDLDLWRRLTTYGEFHIVQEILYRYRVLPASVSGCMRKEQIKLTKIILQLGRDRETDSRLLARASNIRPVRTPKWTRLRLAKGNYFIGRVLNGRPGNVSKKYFLRAVQFNPFLFRAWCFLFINNLKRVK